MPHPSEDSLPSRVLSVSRSAFQTWTEKGGTTDAAALAFFSLFAIAPVLSVGLALGANVLGDATAREQLGSFLDTVTTAEASQALVNVLQRQQELSLGALLSFNTIVVLFGSARFVQELRLALGASEVAASGHAKDRSMWLGMLIGRFVAFGIVLLLTTALVVLAVATTFAAALVRLFERRLDRRLPLPDEALLLAEAGLSLVVASTCFTLLYRFLPKARPRTRPAIVAGIAAGVVFVIAKSALSFYLGRTPLSTAYGAAGSLVMTLVWLFFACNVLLLGNELARALDRRWAPTAREPAEDGAG